MTVNEVVAELQKAIVAGRGDDPVYADNGRTTDIVKYICVSEYGISVCTR